MIGNQGHHHASWWKERIADAARDRLVLLKLAVASALVVFLLGMVWINARWCENTDTMHVAFGLVLRKETKNWMSAGASMIGFLLSWKVIPPLREWVHPDYTRYLVGADNTIEKLLRDGEIDKKTASSLGAEAQNWLSGCDAGVAENPGDMLDKACEALAAVARRVPTSQ